MRSKASIVAAAAAAALVAGCAAVGWWLNRHGVRLHLGTMRPVGGNFELHLTGWLALAFVVAVLAAVYAPAAAARLPFGWLLAASLAAAAGWAVVLAAVPGPSAVAAPLTNPHEYLHDLPRIGDLGVFLRTFTDHIVDLPGDDQPWTTHVAGHPPLATLVFVLLARAGLPGAGPAAALCILVGASAAPSVIATVRLLASETLARRAAPFVAFAPTALWVATSADALFTGIAAGGLCALAYATARTGPGRAGLALIGGLALGCCLMMSYGMVLLGPLAAAVVLAQTRSWRYAVPPLLLGLVAAVTVVVAFGLAGFWWWDGLALTSQRMTDGPGWRDRPGWYFLVANPAALAVAVGPATVAALPWLWRARREPGLPAIAGAALLAVAVATVSQLSRGEVERIYLPFAVWLLPIAALLPERERRGWLVAQLSWALLIAATTRLTW